MAVKYTIYGLFDPREPDIIKYVGATRLPLRIRLSNHCSAPSGRKKSPVRNWASSLTEKGFRPIILPLEECEESEARAIEGKWIGNFTSPSFRTLNRTLPVFESGNTYFKDRIRNWRGSLTQKEAADIFSVSESTYKNWEYGTVPTALAMVEIDRRMKSYSEKNPSLKIEKSNPENHILTSKDFKDWRGKRSTKEAAEILDVNLRTYEGWELGRIPSRYAINRARRKMQGHPNNP